jgi:hypothetical protein
MPVVVVALHHLEAAVPTRSPLGRSLLGVGVVLGGAVAVVGGLTLWGPGIVAVGVAGGVSAALAAGVARESPGGNRSAAMDAAWQASAWTMGAILIVAGVATLAGGVVAAILGLTAAGVALALVVRRMHMKGGSRGRVTPLTRSAAASTPSRTTAGPMRELPVAQLPTSALGSEWLRTTSALAGRLQPAARASIVRRRQETLDELERRDPAGFARWIAAGPAPGSNPAEFVHRDVRGDRAAGTDAA